MRLDARRRGAPSRSSSPGCAGWARRRSCNAASPTPRENGAVVLYAEASRETNFAGIASPAASSMPRAAMARCRRNFAAAFDAAIRTLPKATFGLARRRRNDRRRRSRAAPRVHEILRRDARAAQRRGPPPSKPLSALRDRRDSRWCARRSTRVGAASSISPHWTDEPVLHPWRRGLPNAPAHLHASDARLRNGGDLDHGYGLLDRAWNPYGRSRIPQQRSVSGSKKPRSKRLVSESGGYPFFVQEYASAAWIAHRDSTITLADVESSSLGVRRILEAGFYDERFRKLYAARSCATRSNSRASAPGRTPSAKSPPASGVRQARSARSAISSFAKTSHSRRRPASSNSGCRSPTSTSNDIASSPWNAARRSAANPRCQSPIRHRAGAWFDPVCVAAFVLRTICHTRRLSNRREPDLPPYVPPRVLRGGRIYCTSLSYDPREALTMSS